MFVYKYVYIRQVLAVPRNEYLPAESVTRPGATPGACFAPRNHMPGAAGVMLNTGRRNDGMTAKPVIPESNNL